jgi:uncharacterized protein with ACT and thioredoxin-like domain
MKAPAPMVGVYGRREAVMLGVGAQLSRTATDVISEARDLTAGRKLNVFVGMTEVFD